MKLHESTLVLVLIQIIATMVEGRRSKVKLLNSSRFRRTRIHLIGPNVCRERGSSFCCPGWALSHTGKMCLRPVCDEGRCGSGLCKAPNTCLCEDGKLKPACNMESAEQICTVRCWYGGKCVNNQCQCTYGYTGRHCGQQMNHHRIGGGRHRGSSLRRIGINLIGPNVCREKRLSFCCPGWALSHTGKMCLRPLCDEGRCGSGLCKAPNTCLCEGGKLKPACNMESAEQTCTVRCRHGGKCVNNQCQCTNGYTGRHCGQPICEPGCMNRGRCITPGRCACVLGFTGMRCERDINECEIMRGWCEGGTCVNTDGSFRCECPSGFEYNSETHQCVDLRQSRMPPPPQGE